MKLKKSVVAWIATLYQSTVKKRWHKSKASLRAAKRHTGLAFQMRLRKVHGFGMMAQKPISLIGIEVSQTTVEAMNTAFILQQSKGGTIYLAITGQDSFVNTLNEGMVALKNINDMLK